MKRKQTRLGAAAWWHEGGMILPHHCFPLAALTFTADENISDPWGREGANWTICFCSSCIHELFTFTNEELYRVFEIRCSINSMRDVWHDECLISPTMGAVLAWHNLGRNIVGVLFVNTCTQFCEKHLSFLKFVPIDKKNRSMISVRMLCWCDKKKGIHK